jgi:hypothetical protein
VILIARVFRGLASRRVFQVGAVLPLLLHEPKAFFYLRFALSLSFLGWPRLVDAYQAMAGPL